jgi:cytochrome c oxidase subunit IV
MTDHQAHHPPHPSPAQYVKIAVVLAVLTAVEVAMFYINETVELGFANTAILLVLALLKFVIVIGWYMHLRFEKTTLSRFFGFGFVLALTLYGVVLLALGAAVLRG